MGRGKLCFRKGFEIIRGRIFRFWCQMARGCEAHTQSFFQSCFSCFSACYVTICVFIELE